MIRATAFGVAAFVFAAPLSAQQPLQTIMPENEGARAFHEQFGFSEAVIHGDTVYLSGVVAGTIEGVTEEQVYDATWLHIGDILQRSGSSLDDIVDIITFHTDLPAQAELFSTVKNRHIRAPFPTWTAIDIDRLFPDNGLVEIRVIARLSTATDDEAGSMEE